MNDGNNKVARGEKSIYDSIDYSKTFELGLVVSTTDPNLLGRIKVRIKGTRARGGDDGISDNDLPWCFPMIPKFLSTQPKVGEAVFVFVISKDKQHADRVYIGPIISQPQLLFKDPFYTSAFAGFTFGSETPNTNVNNIPQILGVFPNQEDVSIQGRYNTDITQKVNEIVIRAGKFEETNPDKNNPFPFKYNSRTQGYIQIKNNTIIDSKATQQSDALGTITNIVSNKINLLTHTGGNPRFDITNPNNLITDEEMKRILEEAHQLPFGDVLLEYLKLLKDALFYHVHNGSGNLPTDLAASGNKQALATFKAKADDLEKEMLSKNIRIN